MLTSPPPIELPGYELGETIRLTRVGFWVRARQLRIDRDVLIKIAQPQDERAAKVLASEVRLLREMPHPSLLTLIDYYPEVQYSDDGSAACAIYEFPQGRRLDAVTRPLDPSRAAALCGQLADIMHALSERSHWFRCLPPTDVFVDSNGRARITHLENLQPRGFSPDANVDLWIAPPGVREAGVVFLLGLHFFSLLTGKVPVPASVERSPETWINMAERALRGAESVSARASLGLLRQLFFASSSPAIDVIVKSLEKIEHGGAEQVRFETGARTSLKPAVIALALFVGALLGASGWFGLVDEKTRQEEPDVARAPIEREGPAVDDHLEERHVSGGIEAPKQQLRTNDTEASPEAVPEGAVTTTPATVSPRTVTPEERSVPRPEPVPLLKPTAPPSSLERFVARVTVTARDGQTRSEQDLRRMWLEGLGIARSELAPREGKSDAGGERVNGVTDALRRAFLSTLLDLGAQVEERDLRRTLFAGTAVRWTDNDVSVRYEFSSRQELDDWIVVREGSRRTISAGELLVQGEVQFRPGRFLTRDLRVRIRVPADGRPRDRPNVNVLLGLSPAGTIGPRRTPVLLGYGSFFGRGRIKAGDDGRPALDLPANLVAALEGYPERFEPALWRIDFAEPTVLADVEKDGEVFTIERNSRAIRWLRGGKPVVSPEDLSLARVSTPPEQAEPSTFAIHSFGATTLAVSEVTVEGRVDADVLAGEARERASAALRRELPRLKR